ncbi:uncharacterized protein BJ212DRAFT_1299064 [Suillus subaureus]|uniref:Uncharacterized protein n=1 Tax=Suillus subaureus TaxID=48587 RepID=A0A9P7JE55_9AGAM|nr:uncharacterized protein BJ212DRAFT_1299064 [Suillus subaureus]KAG1817506.1 hypothetical protein BJ212DRAFT_1299064 [Suillus subaureus]
MPLKIDRITHQWTLEDEDRTCGWLAMRTRNAKAKTRKYAYYTAVEDGVSTSVGDLATDCPQKTRSPVVWMWMRELWHEPNWEGWKLGRLRKSKRITFGPCFASCLIPKSKSSLETILRCLRIEAWTRGWDDLLKQLGDIVSTASRLDLELDFDDEGQGLLEEGKRAYKAFKREIKDMKSKAITTPPPNTLACARRTQQKMVPEVVLPPVKSIMEKQSMKPVARVSADQAPMCDHCVLLSLFCRGTSEATKKAAKTRKVESVPNASVVSALASGSLRPTNLSPARNIMEIDTSKSSESEVKKEVVICGSHSIPAHAIKALPSCAIVTGKGKEVVCGTPTDDADESKGKLEKLRAENEHLKSIIRGMRQNACSHQSHLITLSTQAYAMSCEMSQLDEELAFLN